MTGVMNLTAVFAKPDDARQFVASLTDPDALWFASDVQWRPTRGRVTWTGQAADPAVYFEAACRAVGFYGSTQRHKATVCALLDDGTVWGPRACQVTH